MSKESHTPTQAEQVHVVHEDAGGDDDDKSVSSLRVRKRDKFLGLFRSSSSEPKVKVKPQNSNPKVAAQRLPTTSTNASVRGISTVSTNDNIDTKHPVVRIAVQSPVSKPEPSALSTEPCKDTFMQNVDKPTVLVSLPEFGTPGAMHRFAPQR
ncbi:MAG: hypothetical protein J3R72DRAFT_426042 [Linnemannia gamsii]|nr:MAG: hypothetical protein J3R72DRAFT_426042 [Linnemannia gamsii]